MSKINENDEHISRQVPNDARDKIYWHLLEDWKLVGLGSVANSIECSWKTIVSATNSIEC